jgi:hypothetical protein
MTNKLFRTHAVTRQILRAQKYKAGKAKAWRLENGAPELLIGFVDGSHNGEPMVKKATKLRPWTATDIYKLKGLAKKKVGVEKIARALNRPVAATAVKAGMLGVSLDTRDK